MLLFTDGIFWTKDKTDNPRQRFQQPFRITPARGGGLFVNVNGGSGMAEGRFFVNWQPQTISVLPNNTVATRTDAIVIRMEKTERDTYIDYVDNYRGYPRRDDDRYELVLATFTVPPQAITLTGANFNDRRGLNDCPIITNIPDSPDTTEFFEFIKDEFNVEFENLLIKIAEMMGYGYGQIEEQEINWQNQTDRQEVDFRNALNLLLGIVGGEFLRTIFNFDDPMTAIGTTTMLEETSDDIFIEERRRISDNVLIAKRTTDAASDPILITETIEFFANQNVIGDVIIIFPDIRYSIITNSETLEVTTTTLAS